MTYGKSHLDTQEMPAYLNWECPFLEWSLPPSRRWSKERPGQGLRGQHTEEQQERQELGLASGFHLRASGKREGAGFSSHTWQHSEGLAILLRALVELRKVIFSLEKYQICGHRLLLKIKISLGLGIWIQAQFPFVFRSAGTQTP